MHNSIGNTHLQRDESMTRFPDALLIGEMKCGTTALQTFLNLHPNISFAEGEINFFGLNNKKGFDWYRKRMPNATSGQLIMERSVYFVELGVLLEIFINSIQILKLFLY